MKIIRVNDCARACGGGERRVGVRLVRVDRAVSTMKT